MAVDKNISELDETLSLTGSDWFTILDQSVPPAPYGNNAKILASNVRDYMSYIDEAQATDLTDTGETSLHYHDSDRSNAAETLTFAGSNPTIDTDTASNLLMALSGNNSFGFYNSIGGHSLLNFRITDQPKELTSLTFPAPLGNVFAVTSAPHGLPVGVSSNTLVISGASPDEYNGTYIVIQTGANTFEYVPLSDPPSTPASPAGTWNYLPTAFIIGTGEPTDYAGLIDAVSFGSIFLKFTKGDVTGVPVYAKGEGGAPGYATQWRTISSS